MSLDSPHTNKVVYYFGGFLIFFLTISPLTIYTSTTTEVLSYCALLFLLLHYIRKNKGVASIGNKVIILFFLAFVLPSVLHFQFPFITDVLQWLMIIAVVLLYNEDRALLLRIAIKCFTVVLSLSIIEYIIGYVTGKAFVINSFEGQIPFTQTLFNLYRYGDLHYRFTALCSEPGELGAVCGFIIAFVPWTKKYIYPISVALVGGMLSLSLAFYLYLTFIFVYKLLSKTISFKYILAFIVVACLFSYTFSEQINNAIFERVENSDRLDNRSADQVNAFVANIFSSTDGIYGVGNRTAYRLQEDSGQGNAGLKWKLFQYGYLGVGFYFLAMFILYKRNKNKRVPFSYGILYFLLYFYSVGCWGIPLFMLLIFTTFYDDGKTFKETLR